MRALSIVVGDARSYEDAVYYDDDGLVQYDDLLKSMRTMVSARIRLPMLVAGMRLVANVRKTLMNTPTMMVREAALAISRVDGSDASVWATVSNLEAYGDCLDRWFTSWSGSW